MLLEFSDAAELVITNTFFQKDDVKKITYMSGGAKTTIDFLLVKKKDRQLVKDVKVIPSEECVTRHKLLVCSLALKTTLSRRTVKQSARHKRWRLKEKSIQDSFSTKV